MYVAKRVCKVVDCVAASRKSRTAPLPCISGNVATLVVSSVVANSRLKRSLSKFTSAMLPVGTIGFGKGAKVGYLVAVGKRGGVFYFGYV